MGRPLTGSLEPLPSGSWRASVPAAPGSRERVRATFPEETSGRLWIDQALADLRGGRRPLKPFTIDRSPRAVFEHWHLQRYELYETAQPERAAAVRKHFDTYLQPFLDQCEVTDVVDISQDVVAGLAAYLAGKAAPVTVHRGGQVVGQRDIEPLAVALDPGTAGNITGVLRLMLESARLRGLIDRNPTEGLPASAKPHQGKRKPIREKAGDVPLTDVRDVARRLHVIHQVVLWMLRLLGLRVSEAFGPHVGDLIDEGDFGLLAIDRQGGRSFLVRDESGQVVRRDEKERLKTPTSVRVVVVPAALLRLFRILIDAYHTDPTLVWSSSRHA